MRDQIADLHGKELGNKCNKFFRKHKFFRSPINRVAFNNSQDSDLCSDCTEFANTSTLIVWLTVV